MKYGVWVVLILEALLLYWFVGKHGPDRAFKRSHFPEIHEIARLRELNKLEEMAQCSLPAPSKGVAPVIAAGPHFEFMINVGPEWRRMEVDTGSAGFDPSATFRDKRGRSIRIIRVARGGVSRSFLADTLGHDLPADECEVSDAKAGSIWLFYPPKSGGRVITKRYFGLADAITSSGKRFKFDVAANSATERDSLASIVAEAVFRQ